MAERVAEVVRDVTLCPRCEAPSAVYEYVLQASNKRGEPHLRIEYNLECSICGHNESMRGSMPLTTAYKLRYIMAPKVRIYIEKAYLALQTLKT